MRTPQIFSVLEKDKKQVSAARLDLTWGILLRRGFYRITAMALSKRLFPAIQLLMPLPEASRRFAVMPFESARKA